LSAEETEEPIERSHALSWRRIITEFVTVALGVIVGLAGDQYKDTRSHRELAATAIDGVRQELQQNSESVETSYAYHKALKDSTSAVMGRTLMEGPHGYVMRPGVKLPTPQSMGFKRGFSALLGARSTAWQTILSTNVLSYLDYATIRALTDAYSKQDELRQELHDMGATIAPQAIDAYFLGENQARAQFQVSIALQDITIRERETLCLYDVAMAKIGPPAGWKGHDCDAARKTDSTRK
jgi:hypothetical protein